MVILLALFLGSEHHIMGAVTRYESSIAFGSFRPAAEVNTFSPISLEKGSFTRAGSPLWN